MKRAIAFSFLLACSGVLLGDSPDSRSPSRESPSLLQDLVQMTNGGLSPETILGYAKAHRVELPPEVSNEDLLWLRRSGVSERVIRYMSAIDVRASDAGAENVAYDSDEAADYSAASDSYSTRYGGGYAGGYSESYPDRDYDSYPESYYDSYPESYYNDYYPFYGAGYYPYPAYFFADQRGFFGRFRGRGRGFVGRRDRFFDRGGFGRPRFPRGGFGRDGWRDRGGLIAGRRGPGRSVFPRGNGGQGFRGPGETVVRRGGPGRSVFPRGGFGHGPSGPRGAVGRNGGFGHPGFSGGGHASSGFGRGPTARSGGSRGSSGRPAGHGRR